MKELEQIEEYVNKIQNIINTINLNNIPLCEKPNEYLGNPKFLYGSKMKDHQVGVYKDWVRWYFPKGVKKKLKDEKLYKVWYESHDAADPMDSSMSYDVIYIEEINETKTEVIKLLDKINYGGK